MVDWFNGTALDEWTVPALQAALIERLESFGLRFLRMHIGLPMLHPLYSVGTYTWAPTGEVREDNFVRGLTHRESWLESPLRPFYDAGAGEGLLRLRSGSVSDEFPILESATEAGATDYFVQLTGFTDRSIPVDRQEGVVLSWTCAAPGGFTQGDLALLRRIRLPVCAQLKHLTHRRLVDDILDAYMGPYSGRRVHDGQIQRGDGDVIEAVIAFCDLRGSSSLAERYGLRGFLSLLNEYFEVTAGAMMDGGGEILRYTRPGTGRHGV